MENKLLETQNLIVGYGNKRVVEKINIDLASGQVVSLIGPNGCGKSTLLKSLSKTIPSLGGSILIEGRDIKKLDSRELAKFMALVFTGQQVRESISCFDLVAFGRYPYTGFLGRLGAKDREIILDAMEKTKVIDLKDKDFTRLSDGQKQRVLLARGLAQKPKLMILDEPTTFLDIKYKLEFLRLIKELSKEEGFGLIMSLHELELARQISDRIACIKDGQVKCFDSPDKVFTKGYINELFDIEAGYFDEINNRAVIFEE